MAKNLDRPHVFDPNLNKKGIFTTGEAAQICALSQQTIIRCIDARRLDGYRVVGSRFRRIERGKLITFMRKEKIPFVVIRDEQAEQQSPLLPTDRPRKITKHIFGKNTLTTGEVAWVCEVAPRTAAKWIDSGKLKGFRVPESKERRVPVQSLTDFMRKHNFPFNKLLAGVVIVSQFPEEIQVLKTVIDPLNTAIFITENIFEAGMLIERIRPHVVICDRLSDDDAEVLITSLKRSELFRSVNIVAVSMNGKSAQLPFDTFFAKPLQSLELVSLLHGAIGK